MAYCGRKANEGDLMIGDREVIDMTMAAGLELVQRRGQAKRVDDEGSVWCLVIDDLELDTIIELFKDNANPVTDLILAQLLEWRNDE